MFDVLVKMKSGAIDASVENSSSRTGLHEREKMRKKNEQEIVMDAGETTKRKR